MTLVLQVFLIALGLISFTQLADTTIQTTNTLKLLEKGRATQLLQNDKSQMVTVLAAVQVGTTFKDSIQEIFVSLDSFMAMAFIMQYPDDDFLKAAMDDCVSAKEKFENILEVAKDIEWLQEGEKTINVTAYDNTSTIVIKKYPWDYKFSTVADITKAFEAFFNDVNVAVSAHVVDNTKPLPNKKQKQAASFMFLQGCRSSLNAARKLNDKMVQVLENLVMLTSYQTSAYLLTELNNLDLLKDFSQRMERVSIEHCSLSKNFLKCDLIIYPHSSAINSHMLVVLPFMVGDSAYKVDLGLAVPIIREDTLQVADADDCSRGDQSLICTSELSFQTMQCVEDILSNSTDIKDSCYFKEITATERPFIYHYTGVTFVSQLSETPVIIMLGNELVTAKTAKINHHEPLSISFAEKTLAFKGDSSINENLVEVFLYNEEAFDEFVQSAIGRLGTKLWQWLPENYQNPILLLSLVSQIILSTSTCAICIYFRRKRAAHNREAHKDLESETEREPLRAETSFRSDRRERIRRIVFQDEV